MADTGKEIVPWRPFEIMERVEDEAVIQELRGEVIETLVYEFTDRDGRRVVGLSKAGVDRVASEMAMKGEVLRELDFELIPDADSVTAVVKAGRFAVSQDGREILLETVFGTKRQPRKREIYVRGKDGKPIIKDGHPLKRLEEDPFVVEVAMVKAARNAKRRLMPESLITKVIDMARREGKVRKLGPPEEPAVTRPAHPAAPPRQETRAPASEPDISQEDFVLHAKARGYGSWREILEALGMKSTREVREMGYRKALEQLPDRTRAEPEGAVEVVDERILETSEAQAEPAEVEADLDF
ncbi:MAG TPA: hypothetical protein G4O03_01920 [Dehalococcoidia bacterium]|nr:hypothetical protein [Dehalococcoidia bacterium]